MLRQGDSYGWGKYHTFMAFFRCFCSARHKHYCWCYRRRKRNAFLSINSSSRWPPGDTATSMILDYFLSLCSSTRLPVDSSRVSSSSWTSQRLDGDFQYYSKWVPRYPDAKVQWQDICYALGSCILPASNV